MVRVKLTDAKYTEDVSARIEGAPGIDEVRWGGDVIRRLLQINALLRTITFATSLILLIAAAACAGVAAQSPPTVGLTDEEPRPLTLTPRGLSTFWG